MKSDISYNNNTLNELFHGTNDHDIEQKNKRLDKSIYHKIGFNTNLHQGSEYYIAGKSKFPKYQLQEIERNYDKLFDYDYPNDMSYAVKLGNIIPDLNYIEFNSDEDKIKTLKKDTKNLFYIDYKNYGGNTIYAIIRNNTLKTIMFVKNDKLAKSTIIDKQYTNIKDFISNEAILPNNTIKKSINEINIILEEYFNKTNDNNISYLYHGTHKGATINIQRNGYIKTNKTGEENPSISLTNNLNYAKYYANAKGGKHNGVILRTPLTKDFKLSPRIKNNKGDEYITFNIIPLDNIEILTNNNTWIPLKNWDIYSD